jgi:two-component system chemotaxis response regulator CheY
MLEPMTVLIVDDDGDVREALSDLFEGEGYVVVCEPSAESALERMRAGFRPRLMIVDQLLPGMMGDRLLEICRRDPELAAVTAVILTGEDPASSSWSAPAVGRDPAIAPRVLQKPCDADTLIALLEESRSG